MRVYTQATRPYLWCGRKKWLRILVIQEEEEEEEKEEEARALSVGAKQPLKALPG
jgi:CRISPR/Cas system-associated exonuclease Cas4 (RecB family)